MKKTKIIILVAMMLMCLSFIFTSCTNKTDGEVVNVGVNEDAQDSDTEDLISDDDSVEVEKDVTETTDEATIVDSEEEIPITFESLTNRTKNEADEDLVEDWQLVWSDEFEETEINLDNWTFEIGNGAEKGIPGWGNNELQYYTDSSDNAFIENGKLIIQAIEEEKTFTVGDNEYTTDYTSARMITQDKVSTTYGRIEASVKVATGQGVWSAFWTLGQNIGEVGWPVCGELDILEYLGNVNGEILGTVHGPISSGVGVSNRLNIEANLSEDFHLYAIEWDEDEIEFYLDDILYHIANKDELIFALGKDEWIYDEDQFLILNLAIGGNLPGYPDETTVLPQQMAIDYIRIYEDVNPDSINGEEIINSEYEPKLRKPGAIDLIDGFEYLFDEGEKPWTAYFHNDASGSYAVVDGEAVVTASNNGNEDYSIHIYQGQFGLDITKEYTLEFDVRTDIPRNLLVVVDNSAYTRHVNEIIAITETMTTYSIDFTVPAEEPLSVKLLLGELGDGINESHTIVFDNVKLFIKE